MSDEQNTDLWRQAIKLCESLSDLPPAEIFERVMGMDLSPELQIKVLRILENMSDNATLLVDADYQALVDKLRVGEHLIDKIIDAYRIKRLIARGGMSSVYEAEHISSGHKKSVAIKFLSPFGISEKAIELFNREQLILSKLNHTSIVAFHHSGLTGDGSHYLVMEYIPGATGIVDYCATHGWDHRRVVEQVRQLCDVFAYAHARGVIHRDIKPANILMDEAGHIKVIDFGIARLESDQSQTMTQVFTPDAAAPEQLLGLGVNEKSDVFSLGALLLEMLSGERPLPKTDVKTYRPEDDVRHYNAVLQRHEMDVDLQNIVRTAMHVDADKRYADMPAFAADLDNWLHNRPVNASPDTLWYRLRKRYQSNRTISALLLSLLVLGLASLLLIQTLDDNAREADAQTRSARALMEAVFEQADLTTAQNKSASDALIASFAAIESKQGALLDADPELKYLFHHKLGDIHNTRGEYAIALRHQQTALDALGLIAPFDDDRHLELYTSVLHLQETTGEYQRALKSGLKLLDFLRQRPQLAPRHRLSMYYLLNKIYHYINDLDSARGIGIQATEWMAEHPEIPARNRSQMLNSMAVVNRISGQSDLAELQYIEAIELIKDDPDSVINSASMLMNLAILKGRSGDLQASERYFLQAIERVKSIDPEHVILGDIYLPYTTLLNLLKRRDEALFYAEEAMRLLADHGTSKTRAAAHAKLALLYMMVDQIDSALPHLQAAFTLQHALYGLDHPLTLGSVNKALWIALALEDTAPAERLIDALNRRALIGSADSLAAIRLAIQKAWLQHSGSEIEHIEAAVPQALYAQKDWRDERNRAWLLARRDEAKNLNKPLEYTWLTVIAAQHGLIDGHTAIEACQDNAEWRYVSQTASKMALMRACIARLPANDVHAQGMADLLRQWQNNLSQRRAQIDALVNAILAQIAPGADAPTP